ncbi:MAG: hypothetical protein E7470_06515 [Ruminococcaceae bacterium]|nr:hypothetical protein [Oscillospiraceae bacterium]
MMYNRYIPQQDGTYQKNRIPVQQDKPPAPPEDCPQQHSADIPVSLPTQTAGSFLRNLLPQNLDTSDLLIIVLLLLLAGDCKDNKGTWLLTLALYLFL